MQRTVPLQPERFYHVFNRGNNRDDLFHDATDCRAFLSLYAKYSEPALDTYAFCLMRNHFHLLVRVKPASDHVGEVLNPSRALSHCFNAYARTFNFRHQRSGRLFTERFRRREVTSDDHLATLVFYIHFNPQKDGFVADFRTWPWSSYAALCGEAATRLRRPEVLDWFGGRLAFMRFHRGIVDERRIAHLLDPA